MASTGMEGNVTLMREIKNSLCYIFLMPEKHKNMKNIAQMNQKSNLMSICKLRKMILQLVALLQFFFFVSGLSPFDHHILGVMSALCKFCTRTHSCFRKAV
jgi:hypothetical protein